MSKPNRNPHNGQIINSGIRFGKWWIEIFRKYSRPLQFIRMSFVTVFMGIQTIHQEYRGVMDFWVFAVGQSEEVTRRTRTEVIVTVLHDDPKSKHLPRFLKLRSAMNELCILLARKRDSVHATASLALLLECNQLPTKRRTPDIDKSWEKFADLFQISLSYRGSSHNSKIMPLNKAEWETDQNAKLLRFRKGRRFDRFPWLMESPTTGGKQYDDHRAA